MRYNEAMIVVGFLLWWYGDGWIRRLYLFKAGIISLYDYFSVDLIIRSLFAPFRQISAGKVQGSLEIKFRAFVDRLISRLVGSVMRSIIIIIGIIAMASYTIFGAVRVLAWAVMPIVPFIAVVLALIGWMPWIA